VRLNISHTSLAMGQSKNKCWIDSDTSQKQHLVHPFHCLFTKLSLVNTTSILRYQRKILIFNEIFAFHAKQSVGVPDLRIISLYRSLTENFLLAVHRKESLRLLRFTSRTLPTKLSQLSQLTPINALLKETLSGVVLSTWATDIFFFLTRLQNWVFNI
jgi:hypothetical protein